MSDLGTTRAQVGAMLRRSVSDPYRRKWIIGSLWNYGGVHVEHPATGTTLLGGILVRLQELNMPMLRPSQVRWVEQELLLRRIPGWHTRQLALGFAHDARPVLVWKAPEDLGRRLRFDMFSIGAMERRYDELFPTQSRDGWESVSPYMQRKLEMKEIAEVSV